MLKFDGGYVKNPETGVKKDIIINAKFSNDPKNLLIGLGITAIGIIYLMTTSFKNGAEAYLNSEGNALAEIGCTTGFERSYVLPILTKYKFFKKKRT